jgi:uncharacterized phage-associated protein
MPAEPHAAADHRETETPRLPRWPFAFDPEKAIEAVLFVLPYIRQPTLHSVSKVLYQADRLHVARYGRPVTGDHYVAMRHGPVPSTTYDVLKTLRGDARTPVLLPEGAEAALAVENGYTVTARRRAYQEFLSPSERDCLAEAAKVHGSKSFGTLTDESHDAAWFAASENDVIELEHFLLTLDNRDELRAHFLHDDP